MYSYLRRKNNIHVFSDVLNKMVATLPYGDLYQAFYVYNAFEVTHELNKIKYKILLLFFSPVLSHVNINNALYILNCFYCGKYILELKLKKKLAVQGDIIS